ncbi:hypothetical protein ABGB19_02080 [Mycobacterium sp. B14F4]|uniref:hypothetical protein n=1 Tax=Mycobacterium sp. B14F4 TaxID=3153565 RepID=UPI00325F83CC
MESVSDCDSEGGGGRAPDPALIAKVDAEATARHAHHEAGHAVAAVARGGQLIRVFLGTVDWTTDDMSADTTGGTEHRTDDVDRPFVTFAGPWAEAKWMVANEPDLDDFHEALDYVWDENFDGDTAKYEGRVAALEAVAAQLGLGHVGRAWEVGWAYELDDLLPAIEAVAAMLIRGEEVTHEVVRELVEEVRAEQAQAEF